MEDNHLVYLQGSRLSASYLEGKWTVKQGLGIIALYLLEGDFDKIIAYIRKKKEYFDDYYMNEPCEVSEICSFKNKQYEVQFSELTISWEMDYDGDQELVVFGKREPNAQELQFLEQYRKEQDERAAEWRHKQYEQLKGGFE